MSFVQSEYVLVFLAGAVAVFCILKSVFAFLSWYFPEIDKAQRAQLDNLFDILHDFTFNSPLTKSSLDEIGIV